MYCKAALCYPIELSLYVIKYSELEDVLLMSVCVRGCVCVCVNLTVKVKVCYFCNMTHASCVNPDANYGIKHELCNHFISVLKY